MLLGAGGDRRVIVMIHWSNSDRHGRDPAEVPGRESRAVKPLGLSTVPEGLRHHRYRRLTTQDTSKTVCVQATMRATAPRSSSTPYAHDNFRTTTATAVSCGMLVQHTVSGWTLVPVPKVRRSSGGSPPSGDFDAGAVTLVGHGYDKRQSAAHTWNRHRDAPRGAADSFHHSGGIRTRCFRAGATERMAHVASQVKYHRCDAVTCLPRLTRLDWLPPGWRSRKAAQRLDFSAAISGAPPRNWRRRPLTGCAGKEAKLRV